MSDFYQNYVTLCAKKKKSLSRVAEEIGLSRTAPHGWKKGKIPSEVTLEKLSQYFDVPVSDLVSARAEKESPSQAERQISDDDVMAYLWGSGSDMDRADLAEVKRYAAFLQEKKREK